MSKMSILYCRISNEFQNVFNLDSNYVSQIKVVTFDHLQYIRYHVCYDVFGELNVKACCFYRHVFVFDMQPINEIKKLEFTFVLENRLKMNVNY